jgi:hypothetical protein
MGVYKRQVRQQPVYHSAMYMFVPGGKSSKIPGRYIKGQAKKNRPNGRFSVSLMPALN